MPDVESSPPRIAARMRFADPDKFLEFYEKQLAVEKVGLRHPAEVADGTIVHLTLQPPGTAPALEITGRSVRCSKRPDGTARLRVAVELSVESRAWLAAFVAGLRVGLEAAAAQTAEFGESMVAESIIADPVAPAPARMPTEEEDVRARVSRLEVQTYYQVLGVPVTADDAALQAAYHALTRRYHPDLFFSHPNAAHRQDAGKLFRRMNEAYAVLKDSGRRRLYDKGLAGPAHTWTLRLTEEAQQQAQRQRRVRRGDTAVGQTYWKQARDVLERARENEAQIRPALRESARLLRMALAFEPENEHFRHALDHVLYRLSVETGP